MALKAWIGWGLAVAALFGALAFAFRPRPVPVDLGLVDRGPMMVTVDEEGRTRVREVYLVSSPLPGQVLRYAGEVGDLVVAGETVLAQIQPRQPAFLDARSRSERQAAVKAAQASKQLTEAEVARIQAELDYAGAELTRAEELARDGTIARAALDRARMEMRTNRAALKTAEAALSVRTHELATARAALIDPAQRLGTPACCFPVTAPVSGRILRIFRESEGVVEAGAPLLELGDPADLEVVVELLSTDAVKVSPGDAVLIERWGGGETLRARVRRVEPFGFTKVSALGIEEQRVNVIIDFDGPREPWARLGHGYRVEARIVLWQADDALRVPASAVFQENGADRVFAAADGIAAKRSIELGHRNDRHGQVRLGLKEGDRVVLHPSDRVGDGQSVEARE